MFNFQIDLNPFDANEKFEINLGGKKSAAPANNTVAAQTAPVNQTAGNTMAEPAVNVTGIMSQANLDEVTGNQGNIQTGVK